MLNKLENLYFEFFFFLSSTMMSEFDKIIQRSMLFQVINAKGVCTRYWIIPCT